ncbi:hypothetical protein EJP69_25110 [Variovorax gossypii]|uniref:Uncharacterized protein n=1 Tax=Variovorax gossypii TaxID=1679495 RepID=A0A3S0GYB2_9BURK|nr:hypothetical protein [Variovorax gossypii]RTQ31917.1 hypothetical protein EJP69_25110 [Variovorax gossypii]
MSSVVGMYLALLAAMSLVLYFFFLAGRALPVAGYWLASVILVLVLGFWILLAFDDADGPGGTLGTAIVAAGSLLCLSAGVGLAAGAINGAAPIVGFGLGVAGSSAIHLWLVPNASPYIGAVLLLFFCIGGTVLQTLRRK